MSSINIPQFSIRNIKEINLAGLEKGNLLAFDGKQFSLVPKGNDAQFLMAHSLFTNGVMWMDINSFRAYRNIYRATDIASPFGIGISGMNNWKIFNGATFLVGETLNMSGSNLSAVVGLAGVYFISGCLTFTVNGGTNCDIEFGVSINGADPIPANSLFVKESGNNIWTTGPISCIISLNIGDTIGLGARNLTNGTAIKVASLHLNIIKIAN